MALAVSMTLPPPNRHHAVGTALPVKSSPFIDQIKSGVLNDLVVDTDQLKAGRLDGLDYHFRYTSLNKPLVGVEDHLRAPEISHFKAQLFPHAGWYIILGRHAHVKNGSKLRIRVFHAYLLVDAQSWLK